MAVSYIESLQPFIVLDKNQFRRAPAAAAIVAAVQHNRRILLIDTVFVEIAGAANKGMDWKDQFEKDFRDWIGHPELIAVAKGLGTLLRLERDSGASALPSLIDTEMTSTIQDAIRELATTGKTGLAKYDARMAAQVAQLTSPGAMLDAASNLATLHGMLDVWWQHGLAWSKDKDAARKLLIAEVQDKCATAYECVGLAATSDFVLTGIESALLLTNTGYTRDVAKRLMSEPSFTLLLWTAREAMSLYYFAQGRKRVHITDADVELNQTLDTIYLGYGMACRELRTAESVVMRLDAGLRRAFASRWPTNEESDKKLENLRRESAYFAWINRNRPTGDDWTDWFKAVAAIRTSEP